MKKAIILKDVSFSYENNRKILNRISLEIKSGSFLGVSGVNGSGKTTFTYLLNGLIPHIIKGELSGEVLVDGISTKSEKSGFFARRVGMVFQNPDFSIFNLTVREEVEFGLKNLKLGNRDQRVKSALEACAISGFEDRDPQTLSFGEKQKVCLACAVALDTDYIVLDEPTASLDYKSSTDLYKLLKSLNRKGKTIIVIEHDTEFLWQYARDVLILDKGNIALYGNAHDIKRRKNELVKLGIKP